MKTTPRFVFEGVPSFFRAACRVAAWGGGGGYGDAGFILGPHVSRLVLVPYEVGEDEWDAEVAALGALLDGDAEVAAILRWFAARFPRCLALVPRRRHAQFVAGIRRANAAERISC